MNRTAQVQFIFIVLNRCTVFTLTYGLGGSQIYSQLPEYHVCCGAVDCIFTCGIWICIISHEPYVLSDCAFIELPCKIGMIRYLTSTQTA